jgi:GrpB-like predicted nucleotidyltransferase (UPF0157 family)
MFDQERTQVQDALGSLVVTVEHVGSTAVPGLAAKPIIDLLVEVRSLPQARSCCIEPLQALRYTTWSNTRHGCQTRGCSGKGFPVPGPITFT